MSAAAPFDLQLWTSLPPSMKFVEPEYASFRAGDIPEIDLAGARVRVLAGTVNDVTGPMQTAQPTVLAHVRLQAGAQVQNGLTLPAQQGVEVDAGFIRHRPK